MTFSYRTTPCQIDSSLRLRLKECTDQVATAYAEQFDRWLGTCINDFCPVVADFVERGNLIMATQWLHREDYFYRCLPDGVTEFCCGETVLARAQFKLSFRVDGVPTQEMPPNPPMLFSGKIEG